MVKWDELVILPEIEQRLLPLTPLEYENLKEDIRQRGVIQPLVVWEHEGKYILVDGHHRWKAVKELLAEGVKVSGVELSVMDFADLEEVLAWVDRQQLFRRNLTAEQRYYLLGRMKATNKNVLGVSGRIAMYALVFYRNLETLRAINKAVFEDILGGNYKDAITSFRRALPKEKLEALAKILEKNLVQRRYNKIAKVLAQIGQDFAAKKKPWSEEDAVAVTEVEGPRWKLSCAPMKEFFQNFSSQYPRQFLWLDGRGLKKETVVAWFQEALQERSTGGVLVAVMDPEVVMYLGRPRRAAEIKVAALIPQEPSRNNPKWWAVVMAGPVSLVSLPSLYFASAGQDPCLWLFKELGRMVGDVPLVWDLNASPERAKVVVLEWDRGYVGACANPQQMGHLHNFLLEAGGWR